MKRIIVAPDSYKESLEAHEAAEAIAMGFRKVFPGLEICICPLSDGGEGLVRALVHSSEGEIIEAVVKGPLGNEVTSFFGVLGDGETAVIEMAAASGLPLAPPDQRDPLVATTYGTGELIRAALDRGCGKLIIGIGGSATNDGGAGMAQALGVRLLNENGEEIPFGAGGLKGLVSIDMGGLDHRLKEVEIIAAVDVDNPLCGPNGAAYVYGPQKGAGPDVLPLLDRALAQFAAVVEKDLGLGIINIPGAGAAGGLGGGLVAFLGAELKPGVEVVLDILKLEEEIKRGADLVVTGEGRINRQTAYGKAPVGLAALAKKYGIPVIAINGAIGEGANAVLHKGIDAYFSSIPRPMTVQDALQEAPTNLSEAAEQCARLIKAVTAN